MSSTLGWGVLAVVTALLVGACVADEPVVPGGSGGDGTDGGSSVNEGGISSEGGGSDDGGKIVTGPPIHAATSVAFVDVDPAVGTVGGTVRIGKATDETDVTAYAIYAADTVGKKIGTTPLATVAAAGKNLTVSIKEGTTPPAGATSLLALSENALGEIATGPKTPFADATMHVTQIVDATSTGTIDSPSQVLFDETNRTLRIVSGDPSLFSCALDGTNCQRTVLSSVTSGVSALLGPSAAIDIVNQKLLIAGSVHDTAPSTYPVVIQTGLDGTSAALRDVSIGDRNYTQASLAIDVANKKMLVVTENTNGAFNSYKSSLFQCNLDGTSCTFRDLSAGTSEMNPTFPSVAVDDASGNFLVAVNDNNNAILLVCPIASGACVGDGAGTILTAPTLLLDHTNNKAIIVSTDSSNEPLFIRCAINGTGCATFHPAAATSAPAAIAMRAAGAIDAVDGKLIILTSAQSGASQSLFRCNLSDGMGCTYTDVSSGSYTGAAAVSVTVDPESGQILGLAQATNAPPWLVYFQ